MSRAEPTHQEDSSMRGSSPIASTQLPRPETGEEAYLRRLAMSQRPPVSASVPAFTPQANPPSQPGPSFVSAASQNPQPPPPPRFTPAASLFQPSDANAGPEGHPSFQPPENAMQISPAPLSQVEIDERRKNAAAIAAKLAALSKPAPAAPAPPETTADG